VSFNLESPGLVWFRHCNQCGWLDDRQWFQVPPRDEVYVWTCPDCEVGASFDYEEWEFDEVYDGH
jgi:hypothetical protein